jgi:hypothetical protein
MRRDLEGSSMNIVKKPQRGPQGGLGKGLEEAQRGPRKENRKREKKMRSSYGGLKKSP